MIEKIARAIADVSIAEWSTMRWSHKARYTIFAERALKALETPTPEMIEAGGKFLSDQWEGDNWSDPDKRTRWCFEAEDCFTAMIRAAQEQGDG